MLYGFCKIDGLIFIGVVGVFIYYILDKKLIFIVMWFVFYDYNLYENWWNVKLYDGNVRVSKFMYEVLYYYINFFRVNGWYSRDFGYGLKFCGFMFSFGKVILEIYVSM